MRGLPSAARAMRDQLALALAEAAAPLAQHSLVAVGQAVDEGIDAGQLGSRDHFFVSGVRPAKADVLHDRRTEQEGVLQDDADLVAQRFARHIAHVDAVDQ